MPGVLAPLGQAPRTRQGARCLSARHPAPARVQGVRCHTLCFRWNWYLYTWVNRRLFYMEWNTFGYQTFCNIMSKSKYLSSDRNNFIGTHYGTGRGRMRFCLSPHGEQHTAEATFVDPPGAGDCFAMAVWLAVEFDGHQCSRFGLQTRRVSALRLSAGEVYDRLL